jgi:hypothetical protein
VSLANQILSLPLTMDLCGHKTLAGHLPYIHDPAMRAYVEWMICQSDKNWQNMIDKALGGQELFEWAKRETIMCLPSVFDDPIFRHPDTITSVKK